MNSQVSLRDSSLPQVAVLAVHAVLVPTVRTVSITYVVAVPTVMFTFGGCPHSGQAGPGQAGSGSKNQNVKTNDSPLYVCSNSIVGKHATKRRPTM